MSDSDALPDGMIEGFTRRRLSGDRAEIDLLTAGDGPPLLLLHGYPQTRVHWRRVALRLAERFTVVVPDLRGYGRSERAPGGGDHDGYSKRTMANDMVAVMRGLGFDRFALAGHDRGGRVAYRLALDHPDTVTRLAVLNIIPTVEMWERMDAEKAVGAWHWAFLAQPAPMPERMLAGALETYLRQTMANWAGDGFVFDEASVADYLACLSDPESLHATCEDYRAGWTLDRARDAEDREAGRRIACPVLALWGREDRPGGADPVEVWSAWADDVQGCALPSGHFLAEEAPVETAAALEAFFAV